MNNYPAWWDKTVTIYNRFEDPQTHVISWHRFVVQGCFWKYTGSKITVGETVLETDTTICRIPKNDKFLERYEWVNIPNDQMDQYFTLGTGDIIALGNLEDTIDEYTSGHRSSDFLEKHKQLRGCIVVSDVAINTGEGLGNEHYLARGT